MPRIKLTQLAAKHLRPPLADSVTYWDSQLPGFGVRISSKGRRTWIAMYRVKGKAVMQTLGTMAQIPEVADARDRARQAMLKARSGVHPVEEKRRQEAETEAQEQAKKKTFAWLLEHSETDKQGREVTKGFIEQHAKLKQRPGTLYETRRLLKRVQPYLGDKLAKDIKRADITELLDDVSGKRLRKRNGTTDGPLGETRAIQVCLNTVFRWALSEGHIDVNPMVAIAKDRHGRTVARDRVLADDEIRAFWGAMDQMGWPFGPIGKLLLLTAQREGEVAGMRWSELDLTSRLWTLPGTRTKNKRGHIVHLSPQVIEIIEQLPRLEGDLVFSTTGTTAVSRFGNVKEKVNAHIRTELAKLDSRDLKHWVWHDLRRTAVTRMNEIGIMPHIIEAVVNHISGHRSGIAGVYNRAEYAEQRKAAQETWGRYVDSLIGRQTDNVVPLRTPA